MSDTQQSVTTENATGEQPAIGTVDTSKETAPQSTGVIDDTQSETLYNVNHLKAEQARRKELQSKLGAANTTIAKLQTDLVAMEDRIREEYDSKLRENQEKVSGYDAIKSELSKLKDDQAKSVVMQSVFSQVPNTKHNQARIALLGLEADGKIKLLPGEQVKPEDHTKAILETVRKEYPDLFVGSSNRAAIPNIAGASQQTQAFNMNGRTPRSPVSNVR